MSSRGEGGTTISNFLHQDATRLQRDIQPTREFYEDMTILLEKGTVQ